MTSPGRLTRMNLDPSKDRAALEDLWRALGGDPAQCAGVSFSGPLRGLPSVYEVSALASASIAAASLGVAELHAARSSSSLPLVQIERAHADAAFRCERWLKALDWELPAIWDPLAGDYPTRDGFIRLHTNYSYHRDAVLRVLGVAAEREQVARAVLGFSADALESAVVEAGGCAASMRSPAAWREHPQGRALLEEELVAREPQGPGAPTWVDRAPGAAALSGVRVLDLTRVIAGPIGTRFLAAYGADVMRVDPPGFNEVGALLCEVTTGKRRCALDLQRSDARATFEALLAEADVIVHGYRPGALSKLGYADERLRALNPRAIVVCHDAYGWSGPWAGRRGFDSLVQMSCGIAYQGMQATDASRPVPLPAQALDHATGYLIAAAVCRGLTEQLQSGQSSVRRLSLARTARFLMELGDLGAVLGTEHSEGVEPWLEQADTDFGRVRRVRSPGHIAGISPRYQTPAGALGVHPPRFGA